MKLETCPACGKKGVCLTHDYFEPFRHCRYCGAVWWPAAWKEANGRIEDDELLQEAQDAALKEERDDAGYIH